MKDDAYTICPKDKCQMKTWGKGAVKRLIGTGAGLIFKGSGFYITDYRSEGYKSAAKSDSASAATPAPAKSIESSAPAKKGEGNQASSASASKPTKAAKK